MTANSPTIAIITAGGAGMYCGSCMRDNTLARALIQLGWDVQLIPTYTPIRTDEENVSQDQVFYGGLNVFLQQKIPLLRYLPRFMDRWLDSPWLINRLATDRAPTDAAVLGKLTISMLQGTSGRQRKEVRRLADYLKNQRPLKLVNFSNLLIGGCIPTIKKQLKVPIVVTLQGDDLFLKDLPEPYQQQAIQLISRFDRYVDQYITFSNYYADFMSQYLQLPRNKFSITPLGIDTSGYGTERTDKEIENREIENKKKPLVIGYLARHCPEKGLHLLIDAFIHLRNELQVPEVQLHTAGWLSRRDQDYFQHQQKKIEQAGLTADFKYYGVVDRTQKQEFLANLDLFSVPTTYREPKGIFVLESLAAAVPVVQPDHGAFSELIKSTGGGHLFRPDDTVHLAETIHQLLQNHQTRNELGQAGKLAIEQKHNSQIMARSTMKVFEQLMDRAE